MKIKSMIIIAFFYFITSCNSQQKEDNKNVKNNIEKPDINSKNKDSIIDKMNKVLTKQIEFGNSVSNDITDIKYYEFNIDDIEVLEDECLKILLSNGYILPTQEQFNNRVNRIFNKLHNNENLFYINLFDICKKVSSFSDPDGFRPNLFISKTKKLIVDQLFIAEITNYEELYPAIIDVEKKINTKFIDDNGNNVYVTKWKDVKDLPEQRKKNINLIVNRNKYLFNDNKASLIWLKFNDQEFLESLVKTFGYAKDQDLLKWVLDRNLNDEEFDKVLFSKTCDNKYVFHKEIFEIMNKADKKNKEKYIAFLKEHFPKIDKNNFSDEKKIQALYCYYSTKLSGSISLIDVYGFFPRLNDEDSELEFKKNNYYNLPDFKELYNETRYSGIGPAE